MRLRGLSGARLLAAFEPLDQRRIPLRWRQFAVDLGAGAGRQIGDVEHVLHGEGNAGERAERFSGRASRVERLGLRSGAGGGDVGEGIEQRIEPGDARQRCLGGRSGGAAGAAGARLRHQRLDPGAVVDRASRAAGRAAGHSRRIMRVARGAVMDVLAAASIEAGPPLYTPAALALAMPSSWRSRRRFVSNSANTPRMSRKHLLAAVLLSTGCSVAFSEAPFALKVSCRAGDRRGSANGLGRSAQCR
jgi:hypothetical protein